MHRVPYGQEELEFVVPPWFDVDVLAGPVEQVTSPYDVAVIGLGAPHDTALGAVLRAAARLAPSIVRAGGALVVAAQLPDGAGDGGDASAGEVVLTLQHCLVVVAASEAPEAVRLAKLRAAVDVEEALEIAYEHIGRPKRASLLIVPRALDTLPVVTDASGVRGGRSPRGRGPWARSDVG